MYPQVYICLSEGVHLRFAIEVKNILIHYSFPNILKYKVILKFSGFVLLHSAFLSYEILGVHAKLTAYVK